MPVACVYVCICVCVSVCVLYVCVCVWVCARVCKYWQHFIGAFEFWEVEIPKFCVEI